MTPAERRRFEQWAEQFNREREQDAAQDNPPQGDGQPGGGPDAGEGGDTLSQTDPLNEEFFTETDTIDRRDDDPDSQKTIAEWLTDERPQGEIERTTEGGAATRAREAQRTAERAVNQSTVPARYHHAIQRYFGRFRETVEEAAKNGESDAGAGASDE